MPFNKDALLICRDQVNETSHPIARLVRTIIVDLGITNGDYIFRYDEYCKKNSEERSRRDFIIKIAAERKFILASDIVTRKSVERFLNHLGYENVVLGSDEHSADIAFVDGKTGEEKKYSVTV